MKIKKIRHSLAHILAYAIQTLYPGTKFGIGPEIENGFYYDFDFISPISENDLPKIENKIQELIKQNIKFQKKLISKNEAKKLFKNQPYKLELIKELAEVGSPLISIYQTGDFIDLCQGPHIKSTKEIPLNAFKLTKIAGAYWKGDEKNKMLTRIYGIAFETEKELKQYEIMIEEAEKRDHRKLGKELGLYVVKSEVGAGLILWKPKGAIILNILKNWFSKEQEKRGYLPLLTPHIGKKDLWVISGHWNFYNNSMFPPIEFGQTLGDYQDKRKPKESEIYILKPMNCPAHIMIYNDDPHSYKELPLKYYEFGTVYRYEQTGELGGLTRVRGFTQDDAHIICAKDQLKEEMEKVVDFAFYALKDIFGFNVEVKASFRDKKSEKQMGSDADWNLAEKTILEILKKKKLKYELDIGGAAFYGPKIDIKVKDSLGRLWQLSTVQFDFNLSERFNMKFKNKEGKDERPFVIHRALLGSLERFMGVLIEHYAGAFPFWLAPEQIWVIPINDKHQQYAQKIKKELSSFEKELGSLRIKIKDENETVSKKIREGEIQKIPYLLIVGDREIETKSVSIRERGKGDLGVIKINKFIEIIKKKNEIFYYHLRLPNE